MVTSFVIYGYPHLVRLLFLAWAALLFAERREISRRLSRRGALGLAGLMLASLALRFFFIRHLHWNLFDEVKDLTLAHNIARLGAFAEPLVGGRDDYDVLIHPTLWPCAFHVVLAALFKVFAAGDRAVFALNAAVGALTPALLFYSGLLFLKEEGSALAGAALFSLLPIHLKYSGSGDLTVFSLFWVVASLLALQLHRAAPRRRSFLFFAATAAIAVNARPENAVLLLILSPWLAADRKGAACLALACVPILCLIKVNAGAAAPDFGSSIPGFLGNLRDNAPGNVWFVLRTHPLLIALALCGPRSWGAAAWLGGFLLVTSAFGKGVYAGWTNDRYALPLFVPLTLMAGAGAARLGRRPWGQALLVAACALSFWPTYRSLTRFQLDEDQKLRFLLESSALLPPDSYVISYSPSLVISILHRPSVRASFMLSDKAAFESELARHGGTPDLVLFKDFWWHGQGDDSRRLEALLRKDYIFELLAERTIGGLPYSFERLRPRRPPSQP